MELHKKRLIALNSINGLGSIRIKNLLDHFGSLEGLFNADKGSFLKVKNIGSKTAQLLKKKLIDLDIEEELRLIEKNKINIITILDKEYPFILKSIYDPPIVLYIKGDVSILSGRSIAIVGSRDASTYGLKTAERLSYDLAKKGINIVSGLARGIDTSSHKGALMAKGKTIAVLGSGIMRIYPEENMLLAEEISRKGVLVSEFPVKGDIHKSNFPRRNRVISGLSLGVIVVEAKERSGALITSEFAIQEGRDVFAVPGNVGSDLSIGTNRLIKQGAKLIQDADDVLDEMDL